MDEYSPLSLCIGIRLFLYTLDLTVASIRSGRSPRWVFDLLAPEHIVQTLCMTDISTWGRVSNATVMYQDAEYDLIDLTDIDYIDRMVVGHDAPVVVSIKETLTAELKLEVERVAKSIVTL